MLRGQRPTRLAPTLWGQEGGAPRGEGTCAHLLGTWHLVGPGRRSQTPHFTGGSRQAEAPAPGQARPGIVPEQKPRGRGAQDPVSEASAGAHSVNCNPAWLRPIPARCPPGTSTRKGHGCKTSTQPACWPAAEPLRLSPRRWTWSQTYLGLSSPATGQPLSLSVPGH